LLLSLVLKVSLVACLVNKVSHSLNIAAFDYWATCTGDQQNPIVTSPHFGLAAVRCTKNADGSLLLSYTVVHSVLIVLPSWIRHSIRGSPVIVRNLTF
jgi:hypothetical protein